MSKVQGVKSFPALIYESLMATQRLPAADLLAYQTGFLDRILKQVFLNSPYYRDRLRPFFSNGGQFDHARWKELPILTRDDLQANFETLRSTSFPEEHGAAVPASTSGTSGKPVSVLRTQRARQVERALLGRFYTWHNIDGSLPLVILKGDVIGEYPDGTQGNGAWVPQWLEPENPGGYTLLKHPLAPDLQLRFLQRKSPLYVNTQPSNIEALALAARAMPELRPDIRGVFTLGELVTEEHRSLVRDVFGCEIMDNYSASESGTISYQCAFGSHHVNAEHIYVETLRDDGSICEPGETGRIVVTPLGNYAMPLIRYDQGDRGTIGVACDCGMTLPRLDITVGRERNLFRFSDGTQVLGLLSPYRFVEFFPVSQWQLAQTGPETLEIRFVSAKPDSELDFARAIQEVRKYFGRPLDVRFCRNGSLPVGATGKLQEAIRDF